MSNSMKSAGALALAALLALPVAAGNVPSARKLATAAVIVGLGASALALDLAPAQVAGPPALTLALARQAFADARTAYRDCWAPDGPWADLEQTPDHCRPGGSLEKAAEGKDAMNIALAMGDTGYAGEYLKGANRVVRDLGDCVCQVLKRHGAAEAPGLAASLKGTREQRQALGATIAEFYNVRKQIWNALAEDEQLWNEPDPWDTATPEPVSSTGEVSLAERVNMLTVALEDTLLPALELFDQKVEPLLDHLGEGKAKGKAGRKSGKRSSGKKK